jgi:hypothetical protein
LVGLDYAKHGDGDGVLRFTSHTIELTLVRSKTASKGGEPERVTIPRAGNQAAVAIIKRYIEGAGIKQGTARRRHRQILNVVERIVGSGGRDGVYEESILRTKVPAYDAHERLRSTVIAPTPELAR